MSLAVLFAREAMNDIARCRDFLDYGNYQEFTVCHWELRNAFDQVRKEAKKEAFALASSSFVSSGRDLEGAETKVLDVREVHGEEQPRFNYRKTAQMELSYN